MKILAETKRNQKKVSGVVGVPTQVPGRSKIFFGP